jgi:hypothetical protein
MMFISDGRKPYKLANSDSAYSLTKGEIIR